MRLNVVKYKVQSTGRQQGPVKRNLSGRSLCILNISSVNKRTRS